MACTNGSKRWAALLGVVIALVTMRSTISALGTREFLYVDTDNGSDSNDGSAASPFQTLNKALRAAYEIRFALASCNPMQIGIYDIDVVIHVTAVTTPIAPFFYGGLEGGSSKQGWQTYPNECNGNYPPPFPLRMIDRVSILGVPVAGVLPKVLIDEQNFGKYPDGDWGGNVTPRRAYFHGANSATLSDFHLDGSLYVFSKLDHLLNAVFAEGVTGIKISDCLIDDTYNGLIFHADDPADTTSCTITDCTLLSLGPLKQWPPSMDPDQGHAGCRLQGSGTLEISLDGCWFEQCHDAVEISGTSMTMGMLSVTDCDFYRNEGGLEAEGSGNLTSTITVRSSLFKNNAFGLIAGSTGTYDLGKSGSNGLNVFDFDFSSLPVPDAMRVALYVTAADAVVTAFGNTWWPDNQDATDKGCLTIGVVTSPSGTNGINVFDEPVFDTEINPLLMNAPGFFPPGPEFGRFADNPPFEEWLRNYALLAPPVGATKIDFGASCPP